MTATAIEVRGFTYRIGRKPILRGVSLDMREGEFVSIVGPNGAGKSTLLKCLNRILPGGEGEIRVHGRPLGQYSQIELAKEVGYVPQVEGRNHPFNVYEFVLMGRYPHLSPFSSPAPADRAVVERAMEITGTACFAHRRVGSLSGGESQKVHIAAALAQQAGILLLDEPTAFLDPHHQAEIFAILAKLNREGRVTVCSVTHDLNRAALVSSRIVALRDGEVVYSGAPAGIMNDDALGSLYGKRFLFVPHPETGMPMVVPEGLA